MSGGRGYCGGSGGEGEIPRGVLTWAILLETTGLPRPFNANPVIHHPPHHQGRSVRAPEKTPKRAPRQHQGGLKGYEGHHQGGRGSALEWSGGGGGGCGLLSSYETVLEVKKGLLSIGHALERHKAMTTATIHTTNGTCTPQNHHHSQNRSDEEMGTGEGLNVEGVRCR